MDRGSVSQKKNFLEIVTRMWRGRGTAKGKEVEGGRGRERGRER